MNKLLYLLGYQNCDKCQERSHLFVIRNYWRLHDTQIQAQVCPTCYETLIEKDRKGWRIK